MNLLETYSCPTCGVEVGLCSWSQTLVGYLSPPGHNHDDNCMSAYYKCENGHTGSISVRRKCSNSTCDWKGKDECFCHKGKKIEVD